MAHWYPEMMHTFVFIGSAMIATFALTRVFGKHRDLSSRLVLLTLSAYATSTCIAQVTLWRAPVSVRTYAYAGCVLLGLTYIGALDYVVRRRTIITEARIRAPQRYDVDHS